MSNQFDKNSISETFADTLSEAEKRKLYNAVSSQRQKAVSALTKVSTYVKANPVKATGLAVLGGLIINSILRSDSHR
ncbi:MAG: hypothetical protein CL579_17800 [Alteromonadaceae bacterium]|jgi:ElaB/YqjD/DUF883 family membrane-anchored ribosome-binding protein|uniref:DUF883 domain-containing protein n=2 Tax=Paraglaciecola mesophila TaxID=197222 RepID=K6YWF2_9ALTE|nr:hypothetical protein [Paraglaciecola mesophila]MAD17894.1 hypothetical protein [Alteromonadaceae bacterium]MBB20386.1 hypothetical protein [Rickettsiales bacterium]GAC22502.1 hypothetical protein GMES_0192 [Paraglaciecola mesophila KMM 241]|tara:strand:+ start:1769 stop:1999 length:231 start_codon:yes stop_codon:yes gene_type:complete